MATFFLHTQQEYQTNNHTLRRKAAIYGFKRWNGAGVQGIEWPNG
jgi:hypothetical protein